VVEALGFRSQPGAARRRAKPCSLLAGAALFVAVDKVVLAVMPIPLVSASVLSSVTGVLPEEDDELRYLLLTLLSGT